MEHVVFYPSAEGAPAFRRFGPLEDAVRFVEHLRNVEGVAEFSLYALSPVPLAMRAYYRVEPVVAEPVADLAEPVADFVPVQPAQPASEPVADAAVAEASVQPVSDAAVAEVSVEPIAVAEVSLEPVAAAEVAPTEPVVPAQAAEAEVLASPADPVLPSAEPSANGRRGLGFFSR